MYLLSIHSFTYFPSLPQMKKKASWVWLTRETDCLCVFFEWLYSAFSSVMWYRPIDFFTPDPVELQLFLFLFFFPKRKNLIVFLSLFIYYSFIYSHYYLFPYSAGLSVYINAAEEEPQQRDRTKVIIGLWNVFRPPPSIISLLALLGFEKILSFPSLSEQTGFVVLAMPGTYIWGTDWWEYKEAVMKALWV
jgi:hypothetical protein